MDVRWTEAALRSIQDVAAYIALAAPEQATSFVQEIREKTLRLVDFPSMGRPGLLPGVRALVVQRNAVVHYRVRAGQVEILRIHHGAILNQ